MTFSLIPQLEKQSLSSVHTNLNEQDKSRIALRAKYFDKPMKDDMVPTRRPTLLLTGFQKCE